MKGILFDLPLTESLPDLDALLQARVPGVEKTLKRGREADFHYHLATLSKEFVGDPQVDFLHAVLIVLIRRDIQRDLAVRHFETLWQRQFEHLLASLSARWLVSACDTIVDCAQDERERAIACAGAVFMNTIKLYETERLCSGPPLHPLAQLQDPTPLFDGMTSFAVGFGDMILNLRNRMKSVCSDQTTAARILLELVKRSDRADTIFSRLAAAHVTPETRWT